MKKIKTDLYVDEATLREVENLIKEAYLNGWESDDGFLLAVGLKNK